MGKPYLFYDKRDIKSENEVGLSSLCRSAFAMLVFATKSRTQKKTRKYRQKIVHRHPICVLLLYQS